MKELSTYQNGNRTSKVSLISNNHFMVECFLDNKLVSKLYYQTETVADHLAEEFVDQAESTPRFLAE